MKKYYNRSTNTNPSNVLVSFTWVCIKQRTQNTYGFNYLDNAFIVSDVG